MTPETTRLREMAAEIVTTCKSKGWYDTPVSFAKAMALLHSEVSEAFEAWRKWGFADRTPSLYAWGSQPAADYSPYMPKPEGVGSEFADILIRLLDYVSRFDPDGTFYEEVEHWYGAFAFYVPPELFPENVNTMHRLIARMSVSLEMSDPFTFDMACLYEFLVGLADHYKIDLMAECQRKMAYNKTRPYRHGGKRC